MNNRLGIGNISPSHSLDVAGNARLATGGSASILYLGTTAASIQQSFSGIDRLLLTAPTNGDIEILSKSSTGVRLQRSSGDIYISFPDLSTTRHSVVFGGDYTGSYRSVGTSAAVIERNGSSLYFSANSGLSGGYGYFTPNTILTVDGANSRVGIGTTTPVYLLSIGSISKGFAEYTSSVGLDAIKVVANNAGAGFGVQNLAINGFSGVEYIGSDEALS